MKEKILEILKANKGVFISGEELSNNLNVSRTAIWKAINQLKNKGYKIESQTKKGYCFIYAPDELTSVEVQPLLKTSILGKKIIYFDKIDSTNNYAKKLAEKEFVEGTVVIADMQSSGRGRLGRSWISPDREGIWMTILLKPNISPLYASKATLAVACAVCNAIFKISSLKAMIKWPNDIVVNGKKLCGVLTEMGAELDKINYLAVGIGINVNISEKSLSQDIEKIATSIKIEAGKEIQRKALVAEVLNEFENYYKQFIIDGSIDFLLDEYKSKLAIMGKKVKVMGKQEIIGVVENVNSEGHLIISLEDGRIEEIISGEVSVRGLNGYV